VFTRIERGFAAAAEPVRVQEHEPAAPQPSRGAATKGAKVAAPKIDVAAWIQDNYHPYAGGCPCSVDRTVAGIVGPWPGRAQQGMQVHK
jgi:hypothetical protein